MFPGLTTKLSEKSIASATTISADADILNVTTGTTVQTIVPHTGGFSQIIIIIARGGTVVIGSSGNVQVGATIATDRPCMLIYVKSTGLWTIGPIS